MSCHNTKIWNFLQDFNGFLAIMIYACWMHKEFQNKVSFHNLDLMPFCLQPDFQCLKKTLELFTSHTVQIFVQKEIRTFVCHISVNCRVRLSTKYLCKSLQTSEDFSLTLG